MIPTSYVKDGFEPESKSSNFHWVFLFDAFTKRSNAYPVISCEHGVIVDVQSRTLWYYTRIIKLYTTYYTVIIISILRE